jgi:Bacteriophage Lambda NinG protein
MSKKFVPPKWLGGIPQGSHGSTSIQKKYWKVVSDSVRYDVDTHKNICIACGRYTPIEKLQAGHYKSWASCRGYSKWDTKNIFAECSFCNNGFNGNEVGANFKENIIKIYGQERMDYIDKLASYPTEKLEDHEIVPMIQAHLLVMSDYKIKPDYYEKVVNHPTFL